MLRVEAALVTSGSLVPGPGPDAEVCGVWDQSAAAPPAPPRPALLPPAPGRGPHYLITLVCGVQTVVTALGMAAVDTGYCR